VPRPTANDLALIRSNLPTRRVAIPANYKARPTFANMLQTASVQTSSSLQTRRSTSLTAARPVVNPQQAGGPTTLSRSQILQNAQQLMGVPYVWGGNSSSGLDCSAFVSKAWGVGRHTTDNLSNVARRITKDELQPGDALNQPTSADADGAGHVRLFDKWANAERTKMWVYEETPPRSVHHIINWDPSYTPMRRVNVTEG
jgi:cell wall-associated NlpC family hydrolase